MRFLSSISPTRAIMIAALWPVILLAIPAVALVGNFVSNWWNANSGSDSFTQTHAVLVVGSYTLLIVVLLGPPLLFLLTWWLASKIAAGRVG